MANGLKYHQAILDLLGIAAVPVPERLAALDERERNSGIGFPAAVREWFALEGVEELFERNSDESLTPLVELGNPADTRQGYLRVGTENQAVFAWYVRLTEGDDPIVYSNGGVFGEDLSMTPWRRYSVTFTNFIFDEISAGRFGGWHTGMYLTARDRLPDEATLDRLRSWFRQGPTTGAPWPPVYRFFTTEGVVVICGVPGTDAAGAADWIILTASPEALSSFCRKLWPLGTLSRTLKARSCTAQSRASGERVFERLRAVAE